MSKKAEDTTQKTVFSRAFLIYALSGVFALLIIYKLFSIQFSEGDELREKAMNLAVKYIDIQARRGNILADDGSLLATSVPRFDLFVDLSPKTISQKLFDDNIDSLSICLHGFFKDKSVDEYKKLLKNERAKSNRYLRIGRNLDYFGMKEVSSFPIFNQGQYRGGLIVIQNDRREMPFELLAKRTIGFIRENYWVGIEGAYDSLLRGTDGKRLMKRISGQNWIPVDDQADIKSDDGKDILTTIDINLQDVAETALYTNLQKHDAHHGCVVLMEVETGEVKAIANLQKLPDGTYAEAYNFAIGESYEPGSTFKLMSMMVALDDGKVSLDDKVNTGNGKFKYGKQTMTDSHEGGLGTISIRQAFELSSNIGISSMIVKAYGANPGKFIEGLYKIGINKPLGLEIKGEGLPYIKKPGDPYWSAVSLPWMSIGYELRMTPMQILVVYNAIANNGKMMKPMFVKEVQYAGQTLTKFEPQILNPAICNQKTVKEVQSLLEGVVLRGTATNLKHAVFPIAGKTGTAQISQGGSYRGSGGPEYYASFVGYFPADHPRYSCIVVVNKPKNSSYYGGSVAAPIFLEIAEKIYATRIEMRQQDTANQVNNDPGCIYSSLQNINTIYSMLGVSLNQKINAQIDDFVYIDPASDTLKYKVVNQQSNRLINLKGMSAPDAIAYLEKNGAVVSLSGKGWVVSQSPRAGTPIKNGMKVKLILGPR
ncbi:MAG: peptidoglycan glycosyltransferase [Bacteroidetes bacterium HGW-Bacteroidetes-6]|jgi:cell division protein FtsI (penicillin-binding protein 3)|nr:MAG: peptidoglycan glycosyltransferase [Bacteroidetes bacterium HGW-Bacteroidetes-6]